MRGISRFEVGTIPARPQVFQFYDEDGEPANLTAYTDFSVELLGSDNEKVDLSGVELRAADTVGGRLILIWPRRSNVFNKTGRYVLRFKFSGLGNVDFSETHEIRVTEFGRVKN